MFRTGALARTVFAAVVIAVLVPPAADAAATNRAIAMKIKRQLHCTNADYYDGSNPTPGSRGQLDCHVRGQNFIVYVFPTNAARGKGISYWKRWSGPGDTYYFARTHRAVIAPQGNFPGGGDAYTERWATKAADRTHGVVFSG